MNLLLSLQANNTYISRLANEGLKIAMFHQRHQHMRFHIDVNHDRDEPHDVSVIEIHHPHSLHQKLHQIPHVITVRYTQIYNKLIPPISFIAFSVLIADASTNISANAACVQKFYQKLEIRSVERGITICPVYHFYSSFEETAPKQLRT